VGLAGVGRPLDYRHVDQARFLFETLDNLIGSPAGRERLQPGRHSRYTTSQVDRLLIIQRTVGSHRAIQEHGRQTQSEKRQRKMTGLFTELLKLLRSLHA